MDVILIPGFWLDGDSWSAVVPAIEAAGHRAHPVTRPGLESVDADRSGVTLASTIASIVDLVDGFDVPVVLVGHSGGGPIAQGVADARPDRVARLIFVDSGPLVDGGVINDELPVVGDAVPLPDWSLFLDDDLVDLDEGLRAEFAARAIPEPLHVAIDPLVLRDARRFDVPATVIACEFPTSQLLEWLEAGVPFTAELANLRDVAYRDLPTGHWPQFTRPAELGAIIGEEASRPAGVQA
ncbi:alpha/beta fold hydrolase [Agromyces seonyuensis]|uniref:Alpha/beta fold hydrolase n=1 Tax=Agromyces seonyuensis TaxID=2662446 RepID=A0A6I4NUF4_9MICO|nr:alpha/beta hydrolase [Agromyces seonyuensis]MWB97863.1 alpha/beta fold hydrolase [Agromyces seonyuensis]